jgi:hypothetical protein
MDVSIRTFIHSICSVFFSDDICSLNIIPNKVKLLSAILLIPIILTILYRKIISNHDHFEYFKNSKKNSNKYKCCRKIPIIIKDINLSSKANKIPNKKIAELQIKNTACSTYDIDKPKINYLYRKKDRTHRYLGSRCLNTYSISKKLMHRYNQGRNMFNPNYPLFDKV